MRRRIGRRGPIRIRRRRRRHGIAVVGGVPAPTSGFNFGGERVVEKLSSLSTLKSNNFRLGQSRWIAR